MSRTAVLLVCFVSFSLTALAAEHNPLLPRPQKVQYGAGKLAINNLKIRLGAAPSDEDRFAARELAATLTARGGVRVPVVEGAAQGPAITLTRTGDADALPVPDEKPGPESREAYSIKVTPAGVEVRARSSAGIYYAVETLRQLVEGAGDEAALPEVTIEDWPWMAYRGTMMDLSHGPLPTEEAVKRQIDLLARFKGNQYYFYTEASVGLDGYSLLMPDGRYTKDQVRRIIAHGRERHVDVVPCLELYGHLHDLFRVEKYADLSPFPHGGEFNPENPRVKELLADWIDQFAALFPSRFVHIGFDETWQIERAAHQQGAGATPAKLFVDQLRFVTERFEQRGKRVMAWGDIVIKYPEIFSELPPRLIAIAWEYDPDPKAEYQRWLGPMIERHVPHLVATGLRCWDEISPDFTQTFDNVDTFLAAARKSQALGLIHTVWTDSAQNLLRAAWPGMAYGAAASWQTVPVDRSTFFSDYARQMYSPAIARDVAEALGHLDQAEGHLQKVLGQATQIELWGDPFDPQQLKRSGEHREDLRQVRLHAEEADERLQRALALQPERSELGSNLVGARLLNFAALKFLYPLEMVEMWEKLGPRPTDDQIWTQWESEVSDQSHGRVPDLMGGISELRAHYREEWLGEYTPFRLAFALGRWDAEYEYWRRMQEKFQGFFRHYKQGDPLPALDSFRPAQ
jgi:hypothetical protein